ncbi:MAG: GNAT family N-acetyltransferase [Verrucomicrobiaceae bacterium]
MPELALAEALLDLIALQQVGVRLVVVSTGSGEAEIAHRFVDGELKWQSVDTPDAERILAVLGRGQLALLEMPGAGELDEQIVRIASEVGAAKLITFVPKAIREDGVRLHAVSREQASTWSGKTKDLFNAAAAACAKGIPRVHLLDETRQGVLMDELFSNEGVGVMVHSDDYLSVRALGQEDIPELLAMIGRSIRDAHLVPRSYEEIEKSITEFQVLTVDDNVVGCVALHPYPEGCAEVACLYVKQNHGAEGYGKLLVRAAEKRAKELGFPWVFALSNRAVDYFVEQLGYEPVDVATIPESRQELLRNSGRNSMVIRKELAD